MTFVHPRLISTTAALLRSPKLVIVIPILAVFLVAYNAVYDFTLRPLNGYMVEHYANFTLEDGTELAGALALRPLAPPPGPDVVRLSFAGDNVLRYDYLEDLLAYQRRLEAEGAHVLLPLSVWSVPQFDRQLSPCDKDKVDAFVLKLLNHHHNHELVRLFLGGLSRANHMIQLATLAHLYVFPKGPLPSVELPVSLKLVGEERSPIAADLQSYVEFESGHRPAISYVLYAFKAIQAVFVVALLLHVYLAICNLHKIRSNLGLMIGWLTEVTVAALAAACLAQKWSSSGLWSHVFGPLNLVFPGSYIVLILVFSSRNLFRTIHDLAGDNTFGAEENLHKRLIRYYLGINCSVQNSQGVFVINKVLRRVLFLDKVAMWVLPIPNTSVILLINIGGLVLSMLALFSFSSLFVPHLLWPLVYENIIAFHKVCLVALIIDHFLQLTFLVGIIVIDLNRVDLTDLLSLKVRQPDASLDLNNFHEVNVISARLLGLDGKTRSSVRPESARARLGTYFLKVTPLSLQTFWTVVIPILTVFFATASLTLTFLIIPPNLATSSINIFAPVSHPNIQKNDALYYFELVAIVIFVIAISELTFTLTYSKRQRKRLDPDSGTVFVSLSSDLSLAELDKPDAMKSFEAITLNLDSKSDVVKLVSNPKCSFLVSTNFDHEVLIWSPLSKVEKDKPLKISTFFESANNNARKQEFWPINHIELSEHGDYVVLINYKNCRIKCFERKSLAYLWEVSLTSELSQNRKKMRLVGSFFRKRTIAGFLARKMLQKQKKLKRRDSSSSIMTTDGVACNYPPPAVITENEGDHIPVELDRKANEIDKALHRDEFVMVLETGEMITIGCDNVQMKVYNIVTQLYEGREELAGLKIISLQFLTTARVNDKVVCNMSNDDIVVGTAVNNIWRFTKLDLDTYFTAKPVTTFAPPLMSRTGSAIGMRNDFSSGFEMQRQKLQVRANKPLTVFSDVKRFARINKSTIITIDFVGMFIRVRDLQAELIDIQTGTIVKVFHIGHFKPGTFRVTHSEPTHCKFCGCASFESITLIYEDFYEKTVIMHTFSIENKKSRSNICLRVERDSREVRCLGFDSVIEKQYWYDDIEKWEATDMNIIVGIRKVPPSTRSNGADTNTGVGFQRLPDNKGLQTLRSRRTPGEGSPAAHAAVKSLSEVWQGFVITVLNGKLLEYNIPDGDEDELDYACLRPNYIVKYGYKSVAIAFGNVVKVLFLGGDKLIESDLYYSGTTSTLNAILKPPSDGVAKSNELLFISKRRMMQERKMKSSYSGTNEGE